jgi:hypothetical protein
LVDILISTPLLKIIGQEICASRGPSFSCIVITYSEYDP